MSSDRDALRPATASDRDARPRELRQDIGVVDELAADVRGRVAQLVTYFRRRVGSGDADDLAQETLVRALASGVANARSPDRYTMGIARRVLADFLRARAHEQVMENPWSHVSTIEIEGTAPASDGGRPEASGGQWLDGWLVAQPALIRELYERRVVHGESQRQAAAALNLSRRRVRTLEADLQRSILRVMGKRDPELAERLKRKMSPKRSAQSRR